MPGRCYLWSIILILAGCASFFAKKTDLEKGIVFYNKKEITKAVQYFNRYYEKNTHSDTALYFLYHCYRYLSQPALELQTLEKLVALNVDDPNVFLNTYYYYQADKRYHDILRLLAGTNPSISEVFDRRFPLTREKMAELLCGATSKKIHSEPLIYALSENLLPIFPDRKLYAQDTLTMAQLIILLDRLLDPDPPAHLHELKSIPSGSFLYLPYMRLVNKGILVLEPEIDLSSRVPLTAAARALYSMTSRGFLE